jgi:hypothetical protein
VGIDREWDAFARDQARWSAFVHTASSPSTFVLFLHPRLPHSPQPSPSSDGGQSLRDRLLCCCCFCCRPAPRDRHQSQPSAAIDDEQSSAHDNDDNDDDNEHHDEDEDGDNYED